MKTSLRTLFKFASITLFSITLIACSSTPVSIQLTPKIDENLDSPTLTSQHKWSIDSQDLRVALYLIDIHSNDGVATLVNESSSSRLLVQSTLQKYWIEKGIKINKDQQSDYNIDIQLVKLLSISKEESFSHKTTASIIIKVHLTSKTKSFIKTFRSRSLKEGSMSADINDINEDLSRQLSKLMTKIATDTELNTAFRTF